MMTTMSLKENLRSKLSNAIKVLSILSSTKKTKRQRKSLARKLKNLNTTIAFGLNSRSSYHMRKQMPTDALERSNGGNLISTATASFP